MPQSDSVETPKILTKNQKRNLQKRRSAKLAKTTVQFATAHAASVSAENRKLIDKSRQLEGQLKLATRSECAPSKPEPPPIQPASSQDVIQKLTAQLKVESQKVQELQHRVQDLSRLERSLSIGRAAAFVSDPRNFP